MAEPHTTKRLRIGVDVGGTNTDGVIIDPSQASSPNKGILAYHKAPTTTNPSDGINAAITHMFTASDPPVSPADVASVAIGTTHFVNAVVERDADRLCRVAVLRLAGPFGKHAPPCVDWPDDMRDLVLGHWAGVDGGLEVDGVLIRELDGAAVREQCRAIKEKGIRAVVVNGVFSPIDTVHRQEERAAEIVREVLGAGADVVLSKEVANLGFLERENAAILNAAILPFARRTIRSFQDPVRKLGLDCPVFITQNDGTLLAGEIAARLPIRTFSSGPTNSMRGAAFLIQGEEKQEGQAMMVVDIGGTTTDIGLLLANGFPRQQAAYSELAGVRMNFSCPDIKSIGLGGGSIIRKGANDRPTTVGPDSVGYKLTEEAVVFGGSVLTTTDATVLARPGVKIGNPSLVQGKLTGDELSETSAIIKQKLEKVIDMMKTSPEDLPVLLVGGGAVISPDELKGASKVLKPRYSEVANAIGAAMARVSAVVDTVKSTETKSTQMLLDEISAEVTEKTVAAGASRESVKVVEMETLPLQYIANKTRFIIRAAGDFDFSRTDLATVPPANDQEQATNDMGRYEKRTRTNGSSSAEPNGAEKPAARRETADADPATYRPTVKNRVWLISETDLTWISTGCYILGTGGGGSPYSHMVRLRQMLRAGAVVRVVSPDDLADDDRVGCGGGMGSPTVGIEKLAGDEMMQAQVDLGQILPVDKRATHMIALEIGGGNGLQGMMLGASGNMDLPCVDGDWMGRAYPTKWQTTPVVFNERQPVFCPLSMCDGNGNTIIMTSATSDLQVERALRAAISQMGSHAGCAEGPVSGAETRRWAVEHTISAAWRIGRAVEKARRANIVDEVAEEIVKEVGGRGAARVLWKGKIVGVARTLRMGHIPFKNESIAAIKVRGHKNNRGDNEALEKQEDVLCIVPDLISVIDAQNGEAIGTPEYRYGLLVTVLGIAASDRWTGSERGVEIGGPEGFGIHHLKYQPLGKFVKPVSVIDEFDTSD
ncbi:hypothetical protein INS49_004308 [Diaporthe citri]|uniref:uncharacterized protein n=1 Tax=Diaporthe citri TaxID=83186 RepID=UPI001C824BEB|nr:uncharacterized protein INS49_004308 [Diaporthe citri]KAG6355227.1 hypothetical protein INS49_004308 [Diaporthe citri]